MKSGETLNARLLRTLAESKNQGSPNEELCEIFSEMIIHSFAKRWKENELNEDMRSHAIVMLMRAWDKFDEAKSSNAHAFISTCITGAFINYLHAEKKYQLKDI